MCFKPALLSATTLRRKEQKRRIFLQEMYGGEAPNERDDEHAINFLYESFGKKITFFVKYEAK